MNRGFAAILLDIDVPLVDERLTHGPVYDSHRTTVGGFVPRLGLEAFPR